MTIVPVNQSGDDAQQTEEPDDAILAGVVEQPDESESDGEPEPPNDEGYVPV